MEGGQEDDLIPNIQRLSRMISQQSLKSLSVNDLFDSETTTPLKAARRRRYGSWREKVFQTFEDPSYSRVAYGINFFVLFLIVFSTLTLIFSTIEEFNQTARQRLMWFVVECIVIILFTIEYVVRLVCAPNLLLFLIQPLNVLDLLTILPFYIDLIVGNVEDSAHVGGLATLRIIRLVRILRGSRKCCDFLEQL
eukprot:Lithocolla_globosa_v1_NODE_7032_length_1003_cov_5.636076.p1 type:complete len:194 gc:universal NODE_7032_length_1003_cov_5.636076:918-337(-)